MDELEAHTRKLTKVSDVLVPKDSSSGVVFELDLLEGTTPEITLRVQS